VTISIDSSIVAPSRGLSKDCDPWVMTFVVSRRNSKDVVTGFHGSLLKKADGPVCLRTSLRAWGMRGIDTTQSAMFSYVSPEQHCGR
jgi:hypothetical protein